MDPNKLQFVLSTEQYEVLVAFEQTEESLAAVSARIRRDPSVVSRTLRAIAELAPLVEKDGNRWRITPLGRQFSRLTTSFVESQQRLLDQHLSLRLSPMNLPALDRRSALLVMGTQLGFQSPAWGPRNHPDAEARIAEILGLWRVLDGPIFFCQHLSRRDGSPLRAGTSGSEFIPELAPAGTETVIRKSRNSAFAETELERELEAAGIRNVVILGFTTNHCIDATTRAAFDQGLNVFIVSDASVAFDRIGPDGKRYSARALHEATLATLHQEYATVLETQALLRYAESAAATSEARGESGRTPG